MSNQVSWIHKNMISPQKHSPMKLDIGNRQNSNRRPLTEAEIKVKKSLEKLSIPDWYLNKSSKPPKLMMHDTPIDTRLPSWRTGSYKTKTATSSPILNKRKLSGTTSQSPTPKVDSSPEKKEIAKIINRMDTWQIRSPSKPLVKYTQSYPKISPSRKIQNINIVFPSQSRIDSDQNVYKATKNNSQLLSENSFCESSLNESALERSVRVTDLDKIRESSIDQSFNMTNESNTNSPTMRNTGRSPTPNFSSPSLFSKKYDSNYKQRYSPVSLSSIIGESKLPEKQKSRAVSPSSSENHGARCESCQAKDTNSQIGSQFRYLPSTTSSNSRSKLTPIEENKGINQRLRPKSNASSDTFMNTTKKSTTLEQIVKENMSGGTGLIQEIIEEFQKKCVKTSNPTFTGGSKRFVKKLVKVLEKSICEDTDETGAVENSRRTPEPRPRSNNSVTNIDYDSRSVASSGTISLKKADLGSGGSEPSSPISSKSPDYNWSMQVHTDMKDQIPEPSKDNKVRWIPLPTNRNLRRTSSALSMKSRSSSRTSSNKSPCMSPITDKTKQQRFFSNNRAHWNWSFDAKTRQSFGADISDIVCDSGYMDRMEHSSLIQSFFVEYDTSFSINDEHDTSTNRRLSFNNTPSVFTRPVHV